MKGKTYIVKMYNLIELSGSIPKNKAFNMIFRNYLTTLKNNNLTN